MKRKMQDQDLVALSPQIVAAAERFEELPHTLGEWMSRLFGVEMSTTQWRAYCDRARCYAPLIKDDTPNGPAEALAKEISDTTDLEAQIQEARRKNGLPGIDHEHRTTGALPTTGPLPHSCIKPGRCILVKPTKMTIETPAAGPDNDDENGDEDARS